MQIGIVGSGNVGQTLGAGFIESGHEVMIGSRDPEKADLVAWKDRVGDGGRTGTVAEAAAFGDLVVLATAWDGTEAALALAGADHLAGKVLIDATNPMRFTTRLELTLGFEDSAGEQVQRWLPGARVVKAFNTVGWELMNRPTIDGGPPDLFICGDDEEAKGTVAELARELGWDVFDAGDLAAARFTEPLAMLWIGHAVATGSRNHAFKLLREAHDGPHQ